MTTDLGFLESIDPNDLFTRVGDEENRQFVAETIRTLTPDSVWTNQILELVESKRIETRCFVSWLAREAQPSTYLEVGIRRGFSMAMVASRCPSVDIFGFDLWVSNYSGISNPGPKFVQSEMERISYRKKVHFFKGDSHEMLPAFLGISRTAGFWHRLKLARWRRQRPQTFDLMTIDGDHSLLGAYQDLSHTMPYCTVGGAVVFDDIAPDLSTLEPNAVQCERGRDHYGWSDLLGVWRAIQRKFTNFRYFEYVANPPGVGIAVRLK